MSTTSTLSRSQLNGAFSSAAAQINLTVQKGEALTGNVVASVIDDVCLSLRCGRHQLPDPVTNLYARSSRNRHAWMEVSEVLGVFGSV